MGSDTLTAAEFTHNEDKYIPDPFPFYARMRAESPSYRSERIFGGAWLFFSYADNIALMTDERLSNARAAVPLWFLPPDQRDAFQDMVGVFERWLAFHDGASHTTLRRQANRSYMPFTDEVLEPRIQAIVDRLLDSVDPSGFDLMTDFAFPLPAMVIADVLGVPTDSHQDLTRWTDDIAHLFGSTQVSLEHVQRTRQSTRELVDFLSAPDIVAHAARKEGLLHTLRTTEVHGHRFSEEDIVSQAALLLFAGTASIRYLVGNSVHAMNERPVSERQLLLSKDTVDDAVEELLRFCTPVQFVGRIAREDFDYVDARGTHCRIEANRPMLLYVASANRDEQHFPDADSLVLTRPAPNRHLTFGAGRHLCFGDPLVRQTTRIAMVSLYRRFPQLNVPPQTLNWNNNLGFHGFQTLEVRP
ncbi:cytochrome P450 [Micromonospora sp. WMMD712]|uniref:cytochrome P450 n=1 Tax=Micromonospora sp. WMMD712 TaxID=3016096 RepID=UPI00249AF623|nr:cytochrome P450 [Micromonospora sp. WMMD712]WFE60218.1 cytochrome P450 [Micromonospora sp. WMMD712]